MELGIFVKNRWDTIRDNSIPLDMVTGDHPNPFKAKSKDLKLSYTF